LRYWLDRLQDDADAVLELPLDRPRLSTRTYAGDAVTFVVPEATARAMLAFQRRLRLTSFQLLLGVFALLLHKLSGQEQVLFGTVSGQPYNQCKTLFCLDLPSCSALLLNSSFSSLCWLVF
jgi:hypothetical protein